MYTVASPTGLIITINVGSKWSTVRFILDLSEYVHWVGYFSLVSACVCWLTVDAVNETAQAWNHSWINWSAVLLFMKL